MAISYALEVNLTSHSHSVAISATVSHKGPVFITKFSSDASQQQQ